MKIFQKITTNFWFNNQAEEAANYYVSVFKNSQIKRIVRFGEQNAVMTVEFQIEGQEFVALNACPPNIQFTDAVSFIINCESQEEIDYYWNKLIFDGGKESMCGWLKDKFGVSWQIVPVELTEMLLDSDIERVQRTTNAMLKMKKLDINVLKQKFDNQG